MDCMEGECGHFQIRLWCVLLTRRERNFAKSPAIDLMLPPFASSPSSLLLHPHLQHHLHRVWQEGLLLKDDPLFKLPPRTTWNRWLHTLRRKITPARIHFFHCLSFLALYIIVITICLNPGNYATPHSPFDEHGKRQRGRWTPSPAEGAASIWVLAGFWAVSERSGDSFAGAGSSNYERACGHRPSSYSILMKTRRSIDQSPSPALSSSRLSI